MQTIRANPKLADVPLIAVTREGDEGRPQKCLDCRRFDYIAKPVDIELLLALLRVWIGRSRERTAAPEMRLRRMRRSNR
jgi:DNA-binding response OmpR family regulator